MYNRRLVHDQSDTNWFEWPKRGLMKKSPALFHLTSAFENERARGTDVQPAARRPIDTSNLLCLYTFFFLSFFLSFVLLFYSICFPHVLQQHRSRKKINPNCARTGEQDAALAAAKWFCLLTPDKISRHQYTSPKIRTNNRNSNEVNAVESIPADSIYST